MPPVVERDRLLRQELRGVEQEATEMPGYNAEIEQARLNRTGIFAPKEQDMPRFDPKPKPRGLDGRDPERWAYLAPPGGFTPRTEQGTEALERGCGYVIVLGGMGAGAGLAVTLVALGLKVGHLLGAW